MNLSQRRQRSEIDRVPVVHKRKESTIAAHREAVERVILEMRARFDEPLTLDNMAKIACLSPFHFDRVFHETTGIPPSQFLYALRIESAKTLLLTTTQSVTNICYAVGYNSLGTFTYRFSKLVGLSPVCFRRLAQDLAGTLVNTLETFAKGRHDHGLDWSATGQIKSTITFFGPVFVGLFRSRIPEGHPLGGTLLMGLGRYALGPLANGRYFVLAAGFPYSKDPMSYWLPDHTSLLVSAGQHALVVQDNIAAKMDLMLRPAGVTDPPILVALPALIVGPAGTR